MYNQKIKEEFIKLAEKNNPTGQYPALFRYTGKYEDLLDKDVAFFSREEILRVYRDKRSCSADYIVTLNSRLTVYAKWYFEKHGIRDKPKFKDVTLQDMKDCTSPDYGSQFVTREQMLEWCGRLVNAKDKVILLGIFEGIKGVHCNELANLKLRDVRNGKATLSTGRVVSVSKELQDFIKTASFTGSYYSKNGTGKIFPLQDTGYVIKPFYNFKSEGNVKMERNIYDNFKRILGYVGAPATVTMNSLNISGVIHMVKEEARNLNMTVQEYVFSPYFMRVETQYGKSYQANRFLVKYEEQLNMDDEQVGK